MNLPRRGRPAEGRNPFVLKGFAPAFAVSAQIAETGESG